MNTKYNIDELLAKHFAGEEMSDAQMEKLNLWIETNYDEYRRIKQLMDVQIDNDLNCFDTEKAWKNISGRLVEKTDLKKSFKNKIYTFTTVAITAAAIVTFVILLFVPSEKETNTLYANNGTSIEEIVLPDGSEIKLCEKSSLTYNEGKNRNVELHGTAFFNVKKDGRHFIIKAGNSEIEVLGTSFLIKSDNKGSVGVYVKSGRVKVSIGTQNVILEADEKTEICNGKLCNGKIEDAEAAFRDYATFKFDNTPIGEAVKTIEKQTGIKIDIEKGLEGNTVTTQFNAYDRNSIAAELAIICGCKCDTLSEGKHYRLHYE